MGREVKYVICPKRGQKRVDIMLCVSVCDSKEMCEEFSEIPQEDLEDALRRLNNLPQRVLDGIEVVEPDLIEEDEDEDEMRKDEASLLLTRALTLRGEIELKFWEFGKILHEIYQNQYYLDYGYKSWKEFCEEVLDIKLRTAIYLKDIYAKFSTLPVKEEDIASIGWVRLKELIPVIDKKNLNEWIKIAKDRSITLAQLNRRVKYALGRISEEEFNKPTKTVSFNLYEEQMENVEGALEIARRMTGSDRRGYQLEMICTEFRITYDNVGEKEDKLEVVKRMVGRIANAFSIVFRGEILDAKTGEFIKV